MLATACAALPSEGAAPPAAWPSQFRGGNWLGRGQSARLSLSTGHRTGLAGLQAERPLGGGTSYAL